MRQGESSVSFSGLPPALRHTKAVSVFPLPAVPACNFWADQKGGADLICADLSWPNGQRTPHSAVWRPCQL